MNQSKYNKDYVHICQKRKGNRSSCANIALYKVNLISKKTDKIQTQYRCEHHKLTPTVNKTVSNYIPYLPEKNINELISYLKSLIGKQINSKLYRHKKLLTVKYCKGVGIMCQDKHNKWIYVYYYQIIEL